LRAKRLYKSPHLAACFPDEKIQVIEGDLAALLNLVHSYPSPFEDLKQRFLLQGTDSDLKHNRLLKGAFSVPPDGDNLRTASAAGRQ